MTEAEFEQLRQLQNELIATIRAQHPRFSAGEGLSRSDSHERS
jgi:hypothetical protein